MRYMVDLVSFDLPLSIQLFLRTYSKRYFNIFALTIGEVSCSNSINLHLLLNKSKHLEIFQSRAVMNLDLLATFLYIRLAKNNIGYGWNSNSIHAFVYFHGICQLPLSFWLVYLLTARQFGLGQLGFELDILQVENLLPQH